jgi:glycosyltransferase involved in cell wall biosynthesis
VTIYYLAPDLQRPSGGVRTIYRHVDVLNDTGHPAAVVHARPGFRCTWFENETRVIDLPITLDASDLVVVPEESIADLARIAPGARKVVFNQNAYRTFRGVTDPAHSPYVTSPDVVGAMVVSEDSEHYLRYCFPDLTIGRIRHSLDSTIFHPAGGWARQIATVPAKRPAELRQLIDVLSARGVLGDWRFVRIERMSEAEVARTLQSSPLFVSLNKAEGFGLPPAEAIACGCRVVGFHGMAAQEFFREPFASAVEDGDVIGLARAVEAFVTAYSDDDAALQRRGAEGSAWILDRYSRDGQAEDLANFFDGLREVSGRGASGVLRARDVPHTSRWERFVSDTRTRIDRLTTRR